MPCRCFSEQQIIIGERKGSYRWDSVGCASEHLSCRLSFSYKISIDCLRYIKAILLHLCALDLGVVALACIDWAFEDGKGWETSIPCFGHVDGGNL